MATIVVMPGSWRRGSFNTALARAALAVAPQGSQVEVVGIKDIPLYDGDVEAAGIPAPVAALKDKLAAADALLLVTPEYNYSVPGVLKNAIDWLSRPNNDIARVFGERVVGLIGASIGPSGTRLAQSAWLPTLRALGTRPWFGKSLFVADAAKAFDGGGALTDDKLRGALVAYMSGLNAYADAVARARAAAPRRPA
jgi:chromate reductase, NAD(P)H dehydrogenase (quinone)